YCALLIKFPWPALHEMVKRLTLLLGATTEVETWGIPTVPLTMETLMGLGWLLAILIPMFLMLSMIFIPVGQATARIMEDAQDGILGSSVNIVGSLIGVLLYTALCLFYQPPPVWFAVAGILILVAFGKALRLRGATIAVFGLCVGMASLPDSNS